MTQTPIWFVAFTHRALFQLHLRPPLWTPLPEFTYAMLSLSTAKLRGIDFGRWWKIDIRRSIRSPRGWPVWVRVREWRIHIDTALRGRGWLRIMHRCRRDSIWNARCCQPCAQRTFGPHDLRPFALSRCRKAHDERHPIFPTNTLRSLRAGPWLDTGPSDRVWWQQRGKTGCVIAPRVEKHECLSSWNGLLGYETTKISS